jgi:hypothetical protein
VCARSSGSALLRGPSTSPLERTMLPAALTPRRKVALGIAIPWVIFMLVFGFYTLHFGPGGLPFVHWPAAAIAAWVLVSALASGLVITELLRLTARSSAEWSDSRHFRLAAIVSLVLLAIQSLSVVLAFHATGARAF